MVGRAVQAVVRFVAVVGLLVMALDVVVHGGLVLLDRAISWMAGI